MVILYQLAMISDLVVRSNKHVVLIMSLWEAERLLWSCLGSDMTLRLAVGWVVSPSGLDWALSPVWGLPGGRLVYNDSG